MAGSTGRGCRGRGRGVGSPPPECSSTPDCFHMFFELVVLIKEDPFSSKRHPEKFVQYLVSQEPASVHLQEARCGFCRWPVEVLFNEEGHMYLHTDWEKFACTYNLEVGCLVNFQWESDNKLRVKLFDDTSCHRRYHNDNSNDGNNDEQKHVV
nr:B3 domain-containing protein Os03g0212300-like [Lolium perenne]